MNKKIDLTEILKDCPKGWELYSCVHGIVRFEKFKHDDYPVLVKFGDCLYASFTYDGKIAKYPGGECCLFPSKDQRDWSKFTAPWIKKERFDPKTLKEFDRVLVKIGNEYYYTWYADFVAEPSHEKNEAPLTLGAKEANMVIPYNDETKHLVGTNGEAPEFYRYWED